jgi:hypothetical protein
METAAAVIDALARAPDIVVPLVREVPEAVLKRRPAPKKWSAHEHACHLAQVDRLYLRRLDQILAQPEPVITPYDPGRDEPDDLFLRMDLEPCLARYAADRRILVARLRDLTPEIWTCTADHGEYSHYSVLIMFRHVALHDLFHAYRIEELLLKREWTADWRVAALAALFRECGAAHHHAFVATNGEDAEWPSWYASFLAPRLPGLLGRVFAVTVLAEELRRLAADHTTAGGGEPWPEFYARRMVHGETV